MGLLMLLVVATVATVECVNREKLQSTPPPQKNFDIDRYVGNWYMQARLPPCSWAGSSEFTNHVSQYAIQQAGNIYLTDTWRSSDCASATLDLQPDNLPGVYSLKDPIGNVISGKSIIIATDYKKFAIKWGCVKYIGNSCTDPYVVVKTKRREPKPHTWKVVEALLKKYFELGLPEMVRIIHDKDACITFPEPKKHHAPHHMSHLKKTY